MKANDIEYLHTHYPEYIQKAGRDFWHNFIFLSLDSAAFTFAQAMFSQDTILPYFISQVTKSSLLVGLVPAVYFLGYYTPQLFGAYLANRLSRRKPLILGVIISQRLGFLLIAITAQVSGELSPQVTLVLFLLSFMVFSFLNGLIGPAYSDFVGKHIIRMRGLFYGVTYATGGAVGFVASLISKYFLDQYTFPHNFQVIFWFGLVFSFISPFLVAGFREAPLPYVNQPEPLSLFFKRIPFYLRSRPVFLKYISSRAFLGLGLMGNSFYAIYAIQHYGLSEGSLGIFTMLILLAQSVLSLVWGWIGDHFGYKVDLLAIGVLLTGEALLALTAPGAWVFFLIPALIGGVYSAISISDPNFIFETTPPQETSRFIGIANTLLAPVGVLAPLFGGGLIDLFGYPAMFGAILVIGVLGCLIVWRWVEEPRGNPVNWAHKTGHGDAGHS